MFEALVLAARQERAKDFLCLLQKYGQSPDFDEFWQGYAFFWAIKKDSCSIIALLERARWKDPRVILQSLLFEAETRSRLLSTKQIISAQLGADILPDTILKALIIWMVYHILSQDVGGLITKIQVYQSKIWFLYFDSLKPSGSLAKDRISLGVIMSDKDKNLLESQFSILVEAYARYPRLTPTMLLWLDNSPNLEDYPAFPNFIAHCRKLGDTAMVRCLEYRRRVKLKPLDMASLIKIHNKEAWANLFSRFGSK